MAVPKKKTSSTRRDKRRSHKRAAATSPLTCEQCGEAKLAHHACPSCGFYRRGVEVPVATGV